MGKIACSQGMVYRRVQTWGSQEQIEGIQLCEKQSQKNRSHNKAGTTREMKGKRESHVEETLNVLAVTCILT